MRRVLLLGAVISGVVVLLGLRSAWGNGGPFVVKYPSGDPAAKGVLARLDPSLMPTREGRLRVVKEELTIDLRAGDQFGRRPQGSPPLAGVAAVYTIENPTDQAIDMDFGFPILKGIYMSPFSMMPRPEVQVTVDGQPAQVQIISNSFIYGVIRRQAREAIDRAIAADARLAALVAAVPKVKGLERKPDGSIIPEEPAAQAQASPPRPAADSAAREALRRHLVETLKWNDRDAALLVEYAALDLGKITHYAMDRWMWGLSSMKEAGNVMYENLGPLAAIGEQRGTQMLAVLAGRFDPKAAAGYERIFTAWGGDVRERAIDLADGMLRPRELTVDAAHSPGAGYDPTIYARVDFLDSNSQLSSAEKASCRTVLKNLPVVFTFAPMNLLYYRVEFPPKATRTVAVTYKQYCYLDTKKPESYQLSYVLHPASLWDSFGPIELRVNVPQGVELYASTALTKQPPAPPVQQAVVQPEQQVAVQPEQQVAVQPEQQVAVQPEQQVAVQPRAAPTSNPHALAIAGLGPNDTLLAGALAGPIDTYTATLTEAKQKTGELFIAVEKAAFEPPASAVPGGPPSLQP